MLYYCVALEYIVTKVTQLLRTKYAHANLHTVHIEM